MFARVPACPEQAAVVWRFLLVAAACVILTPTTAAAQLISDRVAPGSWIVLVSPVDRGVECWIGFQPANCTSGRWHTNGTEPTEAAGSRIRGNFSPNQPIDFGEANRAIAWLDYEFEIEGPAGFVDTSIAVLYDLETWVEGSAAYAANTLLTMTLLDVSGPGQAFIGSQTLWDSNRQGDQGFDLPATGGEQHIFAAEVGHLEVVLARGRRYRVRITAQGSGSALLVAHVRAMTEATVRHVRVQAAPDVFSRVAEHDEQVRNALIAHDLEVRTALAAHDAEIKDSLARHDEDIKALLQTVHQMQREIIRLLLTPEGRRETTFCDTGDCRFPLK